MAEQRIVITIDKNGKIEALTKGIFGEVCLDELQDILGEKENIEAIEKTGDWNKRQPTYSSVKQSVRGGA